LALVLARPSTPLKLTRAARGCRWGGVGLPSAATCFNLYATDAQMNPLSRPRLRSHFELESEGVRIAAKEKILSFNALFLQLSGLLSLVRR
jgi:hypothetical protein